MIGESMKPSAKNYSAAILVSSVFTCLFWLLTNKVYDLPFGIGDDHRIIAMLHPEKMEPAYNISMHGEHGTLKGNLVNDYATGRFRPLSWVLTKTESLLFGDNAKLWRYFNLCILFLSLVFFVLILQALGISRLPAFIVTLVYLTGQNNETWWTLIPPAQNTGELFLLAGVFFSLKHDGFKLNTPALVFFILSALVKESFLFAMPFILWIERWMNGSDEQNKKHRRVLMFSVSAILFCLLATLFNSGFIYGYPDNDGFVSTFTYNASRFGISAFFLLAPLIYLITERNKQFGKFFLISILFLFVQLFLLMKIKMNGQHHYLIPGLLPLLILSAYAIQQLCTAVRYTSILFYFIFAAWLGKNTTANSEYYTANNMALNDLFLYINEKQPDTVVYVSMHPYESDWIKGCSAAFRSRDIKSVLVFLPIYKDVSEKERKFMQTYPNSFPVIGSMPERACAIFMESPAIDKQTVEDYELNADGVIVNGRVIKGSRKIFSRGFLNPGLRGLRRSETWYYLVES